MRIIRVFVLNREDDKDDDEDKGLDNAKPDTDTVSPPHSLFGFGSLIDIIRSFLAKFHAHFHPAPVEKCEKGMEATTMAPEEEKSGDHTTFGSSTQTVSESLDHHADPVAVAGEAAMHEPVANTPSPVAPAVTTTATAAAI